MENKWVYLLIGLVVLFFIGTIFSPSLFEKTLNPNSIKEKINSFGIWAPSVLILVMIFICLFSIVPATPFIIAAGYLFGVFYGFLYSMIALLVGVTIVFGLAKRFGRPFAEKITDKKKIRRFDAFFHKWGIWALIIQRLIPFYPINVMCFSLGISKMKYRTFIAIYFVMTIPGLIILTYIGHLTSHIGEINLRGHLIATVLILLFILISVLFFKEKIKTWISREAEKLEKELKKVKKKI